MKLSGLLAKRGIRREKETHSVLVLMYLCMQGICSGAWKLGPMCSATTFVATLSWDKRWEGKCRLWSLANLYPP